MSFWEHFASQSAQAIFSWGVALGATMGLGGGAGFITLMHYWPAPYDDSEYWAAIYDCVQDRLKNTDCVGKRRTRKAKEQVTA